MKKELEPGSYSTGTVKPEDLFVKFMLVLEEVDVALFNDISKDYKSEFPDDGAWTEEERLDWITNVLYEEIYEALNEHCPRGFYFGSFEGDGADIGVWRELDND